MFDLEHPSLNEETIQFCWRKAQLTDTEAQIDCPNEMINIENAIQEERILDNIEEKSKRKILSRMN